MLSWRVRDDAHEGILAREVKVLRLEVGRHTFSYFFHFQNHNKGEH